MRFHIVSFVVFCALLGYAPPCKADVWESLVPTLVGKIGGLWDDGEMEFMGHYCFYNVRPTIKRWELYFIGSVWCPGWTPIRGKGLTRSRTGVVNDATADFVRKAIQSGLITEDEATNWLSQG